MNESDIIERLLEVERKARRIVEEAEQEAARTIEEACSQARRIRTEGRASAQREAEAILAAAAQRLQQERHEAIEAEKTRLTAITESVDPAKVSEAVRLVVTEVARGEAP